MNPARQAAIGGGLPVQVPAVTVNRVCGSGAQAIASAALEVAGYAKVAIAGGMENMDQAPYLDQRGCTAVEPGRVTGSDAAVLAESRLELGQRLDGRVGAVGFVAVESHRFLRPASSSATISSSN